MSEERRNKLIAQIDKATSSIEAMKLSIADLESRLQSSWNPQSITRFEETIRRVSAEMNSLIARRAELLTGSRVGRTEAIERNIAAGNLSPERVRAAVTAEGLGNKRLQADIKALDTISAKLDVLKAKYAAMPQGRTSPATEALIRQYEGYQKAFESRILGHPNIMSRLFPERGTQTGEDVGTLLGGGRDEGLSGDVPVPPAGETRRQRVDRENAERLRAQRAAFESDTRYRAAREFAARPGLDYGPSSLKKITQVGTEGIQRLDFSKFNEITKVNEQLKLFVDRFGKVVPQASRQFSSFGSAIRRDIGELLKWSIAMSVIYAPLNKLNEMMTQMIENETKLADATIIIADSTVKMGEIFDIAAESANQMGENVGDVITNFSQAYQATGGMGDTATRLAAATTLMNDALVLSKLSSLGAAESIDIMASALRQSGMEMDQGSQLLDQWVKTTRVANVDLTTLATGFSVLGEAANMAGLSNEELNAILAVTSESLGLTGREAANVARSFVSNFQSDAAIKALESIGISAYDSEGKLRKLIDVQSELYSMSDAGVLSDTQLSELGMKIGQGARRGPQTTAFIGMAPQMQRIIDAQGGVGGQAQEALAKRIDTVQTAMTRLQNAFQSLANSLGDEGGLLNIFQAVLNVMTGIVSIADKLTAALGKAAPAMYLSLAGAGFLRHKGGGFLAAKAEEIRSSLSPDRGGGALIGTPGVGLRTATPRYSGIGNLAYETILGSTVRGRLLGGVGSGLLVGGLSAIQHASAYQRGEDKYGVEKATAALSGGVIGGVLGSLGGPMGAMIGSSIGTAAGEAMAETATKDLDARKIYEPDIYTPEEYGKPKYSNEPNVREAMGASKLDQLVFNAAAGIKNYLSSLSPDAKLARKFGIGTEPRELSSAQKMMYDRLSEEEKKRFDQWYSDQIKSGAIANPNIVNPFVEEQGQEKTKRGSSLNLMRKQMEQELLGKLTSGDLTPTAYGRKMESLSTFDVRSTGFYTAFGKQFLDISDDIGTAEDAYKSFLDIFTYGSEEQIGQLTILVTQISDLTNVLAQLKTAPVPDMGEIDEKQSQLDSLQQAAANMAIAMAATIGRTQKPMANVMNLGQPYIGEQGVKQAIANAAEMEKYKLTTVDDYTSEEIEDFRKGLEDLAIAIDEGGVLVFKKLSELGEGLVSQDFLNLAFQQAMDKGELSQKSSRGPGFQTMDFSSSRMGEFTAWIQYYQNLMQSNNVQTNPEDLNVMFNDDQFAVLHYDLTAINLAQGKMVELQQKQLEQGIWNLPEGQQFWIPIQSGYFKGYGGGGTGAPSVSEQGDLDKKAEEEKKSIYDLSIPPYNIFKPGIGGKEGAGGAGGRILPRDLDGYTLGFEDAMERTRSKALYSVENRYSTGRGANRRADTTGEYDASLGGLLKRSYNSSADMLGGMFNEIFKYLGSVGSMWRRNYDLSSGVNQAQSKVDVNFNTTTTLQLDGRTVAMVVKAFLAKDLLRTSTVYGKSTRNAVVS